MESRHEQPNQPCGICALDDVRAVGVEFVVIKVAMGVGELHGGIGIISACMNSTFAELTAVTR
ncbi:MAG: hypothetical protein Q8M03_05390 [Legionella sp.]|nr:hypothetical protein [Legionella sp.]